jgi:hypothetical protein
LDESISLTVSTSSLLSFFSDIHHGVYEAFYTQEVDNLIIVTQAYSDISSLANILWLSHRKDGPLPSA